MVKFGVKLVYLIITIGAFVILCLLVSLSTPKPENKQIINETYCVRIKENSLADISTVEVLKGKAIFFHESSCRSHDLGKIYILARQACSVESAAKVHPDTDVFLLYSSPGVFKFNETESDDFLQALLSYKNVKILHVDYDTYLNGTIAENLFSDEEIYKSTYPMIHSSDVLRLTTMHKYGGIYLDLDVIVLKNLWNLAHNFAGIDTDTSVGTGVMRFSPDGVGREVAEECLKDVRDHYNGEQWSQNGPRLLQRVLLRRCPEADTVMNLTQLEDCKGFKVYSQNHFYKNNWYQRDWFFDPSKNDEFKKTIQESETIHLWNKDTANIKAPKNSTVPLVEIAKQFCPKVFAEVREYF